jgi:hypothetical protein
VIESAKWVNCVPSWCRAEALSMAKRQQDLDRGVERMLALSGVEHDVTFTVTRGVTRPVWEPGDGTMAMYETARGIARSIGLDLSTPAPEAARTATSPAPTASRRSTASGPKARATTRSRNTSRSSP